MILYCTVLYCIALYCIVLYCGSVIFLWQILPLRADIGRRDDEINRLHLVMILSHGWASELASAQTDISTTNVSSQDFHRTESNLRPLQKCNTPLRLEHYFKCCLLSLNSLSVHHYISRHFADWSRTITSK